MNPLFKNDVSETLNVYLNHFSSWALSYHFSSRSSQSWYWAAALRLVARDNIFVFFSFSNFYFPAQAQMLCQLFLDTGKPSQLHKSGFKRGECRKRAAQFANPRRKCWSCLPPACATKAGDWAKQIYFHFPLSQALESFLAGLTVKGWVEVSLFAKRV